MLKKYLGLLLFISLLSSCTAAPVKGILPAQKKNSFVSFRVTLPSTEERKILATDFSLVKRIDFWIIGENNTAGAYQSIPIDPTIKSYAINFNINAGRNLLVDVKFRNEKENNVLWLRGVFTCQPGESVKVPINWSTTDAAWTIEHFKLPNMTYVALNGKAIQEYFDRITSPLSTPGGKTYGVHPALVRIGPVEDAIDRLLKSGVLPGALTADLIAGQVATTSNDALAHPELGKAVMPGGIPILVQLVDPVSSASIPVPQSGGFKVVGNDASGDGINDSFMFIGPAPGPGNIFVRVNDPVTAIQNLTGTNLRITNVPPGVWTVSCGDGIGYSPKPWFEVGVATVSCDLMQVLHDPNANATASIPFRDVSSVVILSGSNPTKGTAVSNYNGSWFDFEGAPAQANDFTINFSGVTPGKNVHVFSQDPAQQHVHSNGETLGVLSLPQAVSRCYVYLPNIGATAVVSK
ncbi:MAG TPA: hypothetical protein V6C82_07935 [Chroococcales cyanobacterium]